MSYAALVEHHQHLHRLRHLEALASWDEFTMMPAGGASARSDALSTLRGIIHQHATRDDLAELLATATAEATDLEPWQRADLREMQREWVRATALPQDLVEAMSRAESECTQAWQTLRPANDFNGLLRSFREVVRLKREAAQAWGERLALSPYDALLDGFEPGARTASIAPLFARLQDFLPGFIQEALQRQEHEQVATCEGPFPEERQQWLVLEFMHKLGFDFERGRLDKSHHPFCGGVPDDVRITARYNVCDFVGLLTDVLHELGHAKYEQNLPRKWLGQPVGVARSASIHESQSLLLEMQICRSRAFLEFAAPIIAQAFPIAVQGTPAAFSPENLFRRLTRVAPSLIRIDADEATYPGHVVLRFELERDLIDGQLRPEDVPDAWDAGMQKILGLSTRGNDRDGCMQDVHWPSGLFGYFPSYTLGALTAAQLFQAAQRAHPDLTEQIRRGEFGALDSWLRERVWSQGSLLGTEALVEYATGEALSTVAFEQHLQRRYLQREL
jgi:carboxypeptidase Taq